MNLKTVNSLAVVLFYLITAALTASASPNDGASLYRRHCSGCHPDSAALKSTENLVLLMRQPPVPMPAFDAERLSDVNARAIGDFILKSRNAEKTRTPGPGQPLPTEPAAAVMSAGTGTSTVPEREAAAPASNQQKKTPELPRPVREKKPRFQRFVRSWAIKGLLNGEVATVLKFEITANARNELSVVPVIGLVNYAAKVTAFEIIDNRMKLELTWSWRNSPSYWKVETYQLALSEDGRKLTGSYHLRASGGQNVTWQVWGE